MITLKVHEDYAADLLANRVKHWTDDPDVYHLYRGYYESLINAGCFDDVEFDPIVMVDNDFINYTRVITKDEFKDYGIEDTDDDKILWSNGRGDLFLVSSI